MQKFRFNTNTKSANKIVNQIKKGVDITVAAFFIAFSHMSESDAISDSSDIVQERAQKGRTILMLNDNTSVKINMNLDTALKTTPQSKQILVDNSENYNLFSASEIAKSATKTITPVLTEQKKITKPWIVRLLHHRFVSENLAVIGWTQEQGYEALEKNWKRIKPLASLLEEAKTKRCKIDGESFSYISKKMPYEDLKAFVGMTYIMQERTNIPAKMFLSFFIQESHLNIYANGKSGCGGSQITPYGAATVYLERNIRIINQRLADAQKEAFPICLGKYWDSQTRKFNDSIDVMKEHPWKRNNDYKVSADGSLYHSTTKTADMGVYDNNFTNPAVSIVYTAAIFLSKGFQPKREMLVNNEKDMAHLEKIAWRYNTVFKSYQRSISRYYRLLDAVEKYGEKQLEQTDQTALWF